MSTQVPTSSEKPDVDKSAVFETCVVEAKTSWPGSASSAKLSVMPGIPVAHGERLLGGNPQRLARLLTIYKSQAGTLLGNIQAIWLMSPEVWI